MLICCTNQSILTLNNLKEMAFRNIMTGYIGTIVSLSYPLWMKQIFLYHWHTKKMLFQNMFSLCFSFFHTVCFFCFNRREKQKSELSGHKPCYRTWRKSYFTWEHSGKWSVFIQNKWISFITNWKSCFLKYLYMGVKSCLRKTKSTF